LRQRYFHGILFVTGLRYENTDLLIEQRRLVDAKNFLISDLTAARQIAEQKRTEAETASRSKSQFLANMSHELRMPLNAIMGFSEIIKGRILGDDINRNVEYAGLIHSSGVHLLTLINDILDLAKTESGSLALVEERWRWSPSLSTPPHFCSTVRRTAIAH
jgi:two-component system cell cycle sensor histidine kinase PleC